VNVKPLCIPEKALEQHLVVLGKTGAGKSSALRHIVEHLLARKKRVCILDVKGDWWGLKSSADGKQAGFPIIAFGDFREPKATDVPINSASGKQLAELITSGNRPCIIGFRGWMPGEFTDFWLDFAPTLFNSNEGELYVVISECHNLAPKGKVLDPKAGKALHWTNRLLSEGRGLGMTFLLDSQRPQKVHNDTLTCCETLVAMRVVHAADRDAIEAWIEGCGDPKVGKQVLAELAGMNRGEAFVWSPEAGFGPERVQFPMFTTFDSFAPAQLQKKVSTSGWSEVDLEEVKGKLADAIEKAKQEDPTELRAENHKLRGEVSVLANRVRDLEMNADGMSEYIDGLKDEAAKTDPAKIEELKALIDTNAGVVKDELVRRMEAVQEVVSNVFGSLQATVSSLRTDLHRAVDDLNSGIPADVTQPAGGFCFVGRGAGKNAKVLTADLQRVLAAPNQNSKPKAAGDLSGGATKLVSALLAYPKGLSRGQARALCGFAQRTLENYISELNTSGVLVTGNGHLALKAEAIPGLRQYATIAPPRTTREVVAIWHEKLSGGATKLLAFLVHHRGQPVQRDAAMAFCGFAQRTLENYISELSTAGLLVRPGARQIAANKEVLFL
jgi:hypothetical protein